MSSTSDHPATAEHPGTAEHPVTAEDWPKAEALALEYLKTEKKVTEQISLSRYDGAPYLLATWWNGGGGRVLVYGGQIHAERGVGALPPWFAFLGAARLRALSVDLLDGILDSLGATRPTDPSAGTPWRNGENYNDLFPVIAEKDGVIKYVVHYVDVIPRSAAVPGEPPPPGGGGGSRNPDAPLVLQRWSLQLFPALPGLDWRLEERVERAYPPVKIY